MDFHRRCGKRITLTNNNRTAMRNISEFNHGLVLSADPLVDDVLFQVQIDEKVIPNFTLQYTVVSMINYMFLFLQIHAWEGSIEIGVTTCNPDTTELPPCATKLRNGTWV